MTRAFSFAAIPVLLLPSLAFAQMTERSMGLYMDSLRKTSDCPDKGKFALEAVAEGLPGNQAAFYFSVSAPPDCKATPTGWYRAACEKVNNNRWFCNHTRVHGDPVPGK